MALVLHHSLPCSRARTDTGGRRQESEVDAHDHHDERQLRRHTGGLAEAVDDRHEHHAHGAVVHDLGQGHGGEADEQGKRDGRALAEERRQQLHEKVRDAAARGRHGDGQGLYEGQQQHDAPGDAGVHHDLEIQQGLAFHLDGRHDGHQQDDDTRIADGLEEAGQEEVRRQEVGGQEQQHQQEEEKEHGLLHAGQVQTAVGIQLVRFQIEQLAHVGTENVLAEHDEEQGAQQADEAGDGHVLGIVDAHAGHGLIGTEHGQGHLLEGDHGLADLGGEDDAEDHHGRVAVALLVAADLAHAVQDAPADERRRRGTGQRPQDEDGGQEGEAEQPRPARHEFARDEPEGDEARQTVVVE